MYLRQSELEDFYNKFYFYFSNNVVKLCRHFGRLRHETIVTSGSELARLVLKHRQCCHVTSNLMASPGLLDEPPVGIEPDSLGTVPAYVDRVVIEHDLKDLDAEKYREALRSWLSTWRLELGVDPIVVYSGNKSYHVHVLLKPVKIRSQVFYEAYIDVVLSELRRVLPKKDQELFDKLDRNVLAIRAMHRVPYSINEKSGKQSTVVDHGLSPVKPREVEVYFTESRDLERRALVLAEHRRAVLAEKIERAREKLKVKDNKKVADKYDYIERILAASGIPDGRERIIYYWLSKYLVTVKGLSVEECLDVILDWVSRQGRGDGKIYESWIRNQCRYAYEKKLKPWSLKKVYSRDPELVKMLLDLGIFDRELLRKHGIADL